MWRRAQRRKGRWWDGASELNERNLYIRVANTKCTVEILLMGRVEPGPAYASGAD